MKIREQRKKLLDLPYAPEAEALLDELERSGQFRVGLDAEVDDESDVGSREQRLLLGPRLRHRRRSRTGGLPGSVALRVGPGIGHDDIVLARVNDSLVLRTHDGLDRVVLEGYLGLIPDASTLRIIFNDGSEWTGQALTARISRAAWSATQPANDDSPG